jgi:hypothetical protein
MRVSPVLGPDGDAYFTWGGPDAHDAGSLHGWKWALEWIRLNGRTQGVLVVGPAFGQKGCAVFPTTTLTHVFGIDKNGKATGQFDMRVAEDVMRENLKAMGREPGRSDMHSLLNVILEKGIECYAMPVAPKHVRRQIQGKPTWDIAARAKASGKTLLERSI